MAKRLKDMTEKELNAYYREKKIREDSRALRKYQKRLEDERKTYERKFEAYAINQRKSRALAIGECALQAMDDIRGLARVKPLVAGTLDYLIVEEKVQDETGKKGFKCCVIYHVASREPAHDPEDIRKEIEDTFEKMMRETDVLYPVEVKDEKEECDSAPV